MTSSAEKHFETSRGFWQRSASPASAPRDLTEGSGVATAPERGGSPTMEHDTKTAQAPTVLAVIKLDPVGVGSVPNEFGSKRCDVLDVHFEPTALEVLLAQHKALR